MTAISIIYEDTTAKVITTDKETETFNILAGVLQGDTLAPYIFVLVIDYVMRTALEGRENKLGFQLRIGKSRRVPLITVIDMDFADDIALVSGRYQRSPRDTHSSRKISKMSRTKHEYRENEIHELQY